MTPDSFIERLGREKSSAILRTDNQEKAAKAMDAAIRGGFNIIEFTLTIPGVFELVQDYSRREGLVVGTGTVMDAAQAQQCPVTVVGARARRWTVSGDRALAALQ